MAMMATLARSRRAITQGVGRGAEAGGEPACGSLAGLVSILVTIALLLTEPGDEV